MITPKTISFESIGQVSIHKELFGEQPVIICHGQDFIDPTIIMDNLTKEIDDPESQCLVVVDILSKNEKPKLMMQLEMVKISELIPTNKLLNLPSGPKGNLEAILEKLDVCEAIKKFKLSEQKMELEQKLNQDGNNLEAKEVKKYGSFSLRLFPFHKGFNKITRYIPPIIQPLAEQDILSYQKVKKLSTYQYILALSQYSQKFDAQLQTTLYLNWGQEIVEFSLFPQDQRDVSKVQLQPLQILIIPPRYSYKWNSGQTSFTKLLTWKIIPKKGLQELLKNLQNQTLRQRCHYAIDQVFIDYCFHQFSLIEAKNEVFMFSIANYINQQFHKEFDFLNKELSVEEKEISGYGLNDKKIDECENCGSQIINYFAVYKDIVYCVTCVREENKINQIYHKISTKVIQLGCQLLNNVYRYKQDKKTSEQNAEMLMKSAVFFEFQDHCDGDFVGAYNSSRCKIHEGNQKKQKNSRQKIVQNTVKQIKESIGVSSALQILSQYSGMKYTNHVEKELYQQILVRTSNFIKKEEQKEWLKIMMPEYNENDLKLFAIQLCVKDKFGSGSLKNTQ